MNILNKSLLATAVGMAITSSVAQADIKLGRGLSVTGFIDMSFVYTDPDGSDTTTKVFGVDQVEADFMYKGANGVSAQVDIEYGEGEAGDPDNTTTFVEQAFISKAVNDQLSIKAGRFLSYSGWETEEPTGLYQYSGTGYGGYFYGGYQQGVSAYYDTETVDLMVSVVNDLADDTEDDTTQLGAEFGVAVEPVDGLTAKLFYMTEADNDIVNFWTSYEIDALTLAVEVNSADYADDSEGTGFLLMANYAMNDFGVTVRYHDFEIEDADGNTLDENDAITIAPSYAVSDNLLIVAEYRMDSFGDSDVDSFALEALYTY